MLEEMKFKRKEKAKYIIRCILVTILSVAAFIVTDWYFMMTMIEQHSMIKFIIGTSLMFFVLISWGVYSIIIWKYIEKKYNQNIAEYQMCLKVDKFLKDLDEKEIIQVKLKMANDLSPEFQKAVLNPKLTYYVRKKNLGDDLEIVIYKKKKMIGFYKLSCDYKFFFKHFEPIYERSAERKEKE